MKRIFAFVASIAFVALIAMGCAEIVPPNPVEVIKRPLGRIKEIRIGMTKSEIRTRWGDPDMVERTGTTPLGETKEKWTYQARMPGAPVDYRYVSQTRHLYFDGKSLVKIETD